MKELDQLREAVEHTHGGTATFAQSVPVRETLEGKMVWEGVVHVFDLARHPSATRAYAWSTPIEGSTKRRFLAVLHTDRINSPLEAVRAAIVAENKKTVISCAQISAIAGFIVVVAGIVITGFELIRGRGIFLGPHQFLDIPVPGIRASLTFRGAQGR
jgi:hypothetical protein